MTGVVEAFFFASAGVLFLALASVLFVFAWRMVDERINDRRK